MKTENNKEKNYSKIYREKLFLFVKDVKDAKVKGERTLYSLVLAKSEELDKLINNGDDDKKKLILFYLLKFSLYFIEENKFIKEDYFELNANKIHKAFYELLLNPTESQFENFIISFENLDYGSDIIFLICDNILSNVKSLAIDMYFRIALEKHFYSLKDYFDFPINPDRNNLILKLSNYFKIKYNKKEVTKVELTNLFAEKPKEQKIKKKNGNLLINKIKENEDIPIEDEKINDSKKEQKSKKSGKRRRNKKKKIIKEDEKENKKEDEKENKIEGEKENKIEDEKENKKEDEKENKKEDENEIANMKNNVPSSESNIQISEIIVKNNVKYEKFFNYLKDMNVLYESLGYKPPVLIHLIQNEGVINVDYLKYEKGSNSFIDHLYDNLENFLLKLSLNEINFDEGKYGYFCDKKNDYYLEGIFSIVDLDLLNEKISSDENFPKDNLMCPDENIARNAFKSRALSFEYYINNTILLYDLKVKERPRIIYFFKPIDEIEESNENTINDVNVDDTKYKIIEVDGVVLEKKNLFCNLDEKLFMIDQSYKFNVFEDKYKKKSIDNYVDNDAKNPLYNFTIEANTLCVIEIKNRFPPYSKSNSKKNENKNEHNKEMNSLDKGVPFYNMVKELIQKALIFRTLFTHLKYEIKQIKLILFYDTIHKYNYEGELIKAFNEVLDINDEKLIEMFQFQCIYIKPSYLAGGLIHLNNDLESLRSENISLKNQLNQTQEKVDFLQKQLNNLKEELKKKQDKKD